MARRRKRTNPKPWERYERVKATPGFSVMFSDLMSTKNPGEKLFNELYICIHHARGIPPPRRIMTKEIYRSEDNIDITDYKILMCPSDPVIISEKNGISVKFDFAISSQFYREHLESRNDGLQRGIVVSMACSLFEKKYGTKINIKKAKYSDNNFVQNMVDVRLPRNISVKTANQWYNKDTIRVGVQRVGKVKQRRDDIGCFSCGYGHVNPRLHVDALAERIRHNVSLLQTAIAAADEDDSSVMARCATCVAPRCDSKWLEVRFMHRLDLQETPLSTKLFHLHITGETRNKIEVRDRNDNVLGAVTISRAIDIDESTLHIRHEWEEKSIVVVARATRFPGIRLYG